MANFNRRGPEEEGPMTGRGLGRCAADEVESPVKDLPDEPMFPRRRRGFTGRGSRRGGRGLRRGPRGFRGRERW